MTTNVQTFLCASETWIQFACYLGCALYTGGGLPGLNIQNAWKKSQAETMPSPWEKWAITHLQEGSLLCIQIGTSSTMHHCFEYKQKGCNCNLDYPNYFLLFIQQSDLALQNFCRFRCDARSTNLHQEPSHLLMYQWYWPVRLVQCYLKLLRRQDWA